MDNSIIPTGGDAIVFLVHNSAIRYAVENGKRYYSLVDFVSFFSDTEDDPAKYWFNVKRSMINRYGFEVSSNIRKFKFPAPDGKMRATDCGDIVTIRRVIMSIPSIKAEPLRMWLAGKDDALLQYREQNVLNGLEWAADTIQGEIGNEPSADSDSAWREIGYE